MSDPRKMPPFGDDIPPFGGGGGQMPPSMKQPKQGGIPEGNRSNPPSSKPPKSSNNNKGDGSVVKTFYNKFLLGKLWTYILGNPSEAAADGLRFVAIGAPLICGIWLGTTIKYDGIFGWFTGPSSTAGVVIKTGIDQISESAINEDGAPLWYKDAEIERVGTGVTLKDIETAEAKKEEEAE